MSIKNFGVLAFASAAVAAGHHGHQHLHARGTGPAPAIPTGLPACWGACFKDVSSPEALCNDEKVTNCIKETCATEDTASYEAWLEKQCNSGAPYPSGPNNGTVGPTGSGVVGPTGGYSTSVCTETSTLIYQTTTQYSTYLITHTLTAPGGYGTASASSDVPISPVTDGGEGPGGYGPGAPSGAPSGGAGSPSGGPGGYGPGAPSGTPNSPIGGEGEGEGEECSEVTVTTTERTTVTVTAGEGSGPSSEAPAPSSYAAPSAPASEAEPTTEAAPSSPAAPAPSSYVSEADAPAPSSYAAPSSEASAPAAPSYGSPASSDTPDQPEQSEKPKPKPSSPPTYDTGFRGKRGIAYNDSSMVIPAITDSGKIGWASNWEGIPKGFENSGVTFIPTLHSGDSYWTGMWTDQVAEAKAAGLPYLFGPNEPDMESQANLLPEDCANLWREWMEPHAGDFQLVAPSVSSTVAPGKGQDWLDQFMGNCSDCTINAVNQHWYAVDSNDLESFKDSVDGAGKYGPVFVGEFAAVGSDDEKNDFMNKAMDWMDTNDNVLGYAYFMVYEGLLVSGDSLTPTGENFCNGGW